MAERDLTSRQMELYQVMSDISEDCYCAGWLIGNEYTIWSAIQSGDHRYGLAEIEPEQLEQCRILSEELGGWIVWADDETDPVLPRDMWGPKFVSMSEWLEMFAQEITKGGR
jgi:hypothetical protein